MSTCNSERELKRVFQEIRSEDAKHTPTLDRVLHRTRPRTALFPAWGLWAAAAVVVAVALLPIGLRQYSADQAENEIQDWASVAAWEAPTDELLTNPNANDGAEPDDQWIPRDSSESRQPLQHGRNVS